VGGYSVWEPNVIPHELHRLFPDDTFVWGGDFNTDPPVWTTSLASPAAPPHV